MKKCYKGKIVGLLTGSPFDIIFFLNFTLSEDFLKGS